MKTLLEWLEENRSSLSDGVYEVGSMGKLIYNNVTFNYDEFGRFYLSPDRYELKEGCISLLCGADPFQSLSKPKNKYSRQCKGVTIDVYDVLKAFEVTDPALQHLIKKALCAGLRGHKNKEQDLIDILDSANRALELYHDDNGSTERPPEVSGVRRCDDNAETEHRRIKRIINRC